MRDLSNFFTIIISSVVFMTATAIAQYESAYDDVSDGQYENPFDNNDNPGFGNEEVNPYPDQTYGSEEASSSTGIEGYSYDDQSNDSFGNEDSFSSTNTENDPWADSPSNEYETF